MARVHRETRIAVAPEGNKCGIRIPHQNTSMVFIMDDGDVGKEPGGFGASIKKLRVCRNNETIAACEASLSDAHNFAFSPDGTHLAFAWPVVKDGARIFVIIIDGEERYVCPPETDYVNHLFWLDNDRLCWQAIHREPHTSQYFVNGEEWTGRIRVQDCWSDEWSQFLTHHVVEDGWYRVIKPDGSTTEPRKVSDRFDLLGGYESDEGPSPRERPEWPESKQWYDGGSCYLYRETIGPSYDLLSGCIVSTDRSSFAYVGTRYYTFAARVSESLTRGFARLRKARVPEKPVAGIPILLRPAAIALAILFANPRAISDENFMPHLRFPVKGDKPWFKGYANVDNFLFTGQSELAAVVQTPDGWHLAIDEEEGPAYHEIINPRFFPDEGLCYIGRRGNEYFRVVVA
ncbi:MAG: hypothetical protein Q8P82_02495 [bacterium]|nr:hypothetical protein [bacterium]